MQFIPYRHEWELTHLSSFKISASLSGSKIEAMEEFDVSTSKEGGSGLSAKLDQAKRWLFSHSQHLNFFTILTLASVST
jgi:vacuole membrane protein 1